MGSISAVSVSTLLCNIGGTRFQAPSASLGIVSGFRRNSPITINSNSLRSPLLHCSLLPSSSLSFPSSVSGLSLGLELNLNAGFGAVKRRGFVVRAGKAALCLTKRSRSRKSLARTHGFRLRMRTTSGRAIMKRRRAKGRKVLCTKSYPRSGKYC